MAAARRRLAGIAVYAAVVLGALMFGAGCSAALERLVPAGRDEEETFENPKKKKKQKQKNAVSGEAAEAAEAAGAAGAAGAAEAADGKVPGAEGCRRDACALAEQRAVNDPMVSPRRCGKRAGGGGGEYAALLSSALANTAGDARFGSDQLVPAGMEEAARCTDDGAADGQPTMAALLACRNLDGVFQICRMRRQNRECRQRRRREREGKTHSEPPDEGGGDRQYTRRS